MSTATSSILTGADANEKARQSNMLSPRFYTTDHAGFDRLSVEPLRAEWDAMMKEYEGDNNHDHFQRDAEFLQELEACAPNWSPELRQEMLDFFVSSLTSEFSGCVLYNEIRKNVNNPDIKQWMTYMARDESRHAGFINMSLRDFDLGIELGKLKSDKPYTFFKPIHVIYATYLSEKIGYARYITIYRQLERHPDKRFHPIFRWFERWCNDEFRHGESFALIMRANPYMLQGFNLLKIRFFLLAVYATMYVRDHRRPLLHQAMGLESEAYDREVFRITNEITQQVFPIALDIDHPAFMSGLAHLVEITDDFDAAKARGGISGLLGRAWHGGRALVQFAQLFLLPVQRQQLLEEPRMRPTW